MKDRSKVILKLLTQNGKIEVAKLSDILGVSQVTVRKDLDKLVAQGLIRREHGFAELNSADDITIRLAYHYEEKSKIAAKAAELVQDGDTIMIESGSCCALLALVLTETRKSLTIVTNSAFIADFIRKKTSFQIVLLGGIYQLDSQCLVGPMISQGAMNYNVEYLFIGTDGYSQKSGFTNKDQMRAQAVRDMADSAENVVIVTESSKFDVCGTVPLNLGEQSQIVITDDRISPEAVDNLTTSGIRLITI